MARPQRCVKARLHRRFLSRQLDAIFVALKLQQVSNIFETPAISRRQIALKIAPGLHVRFWSCNFGATKIASSCRGKNCLCKRGLRKRLFFHLFRFTQPEKKLLLPLSNHVWPALLCDYLLIFSREHVLQMHRGETEFSKEVYVSPTGLVVSP